jgi:hypothetical protein
LLAASIVDDMLAADADGAGPHGMEVCRRHGDEYAGRPREFVFRIRGRVRPHPTQDDGELITTSPVIWFNCKCALRADTGMHLRTRRAGPRRNRHVIFPSEKIDGSGSESFPIGKIILSCIIRSGTMLIIPTGTMHIGKLDGS